MQKPTLLPFAKPLGLAIAILLSGCAHTLSKTDSINQRDDGGAQSVKRAASESGQTNNLTQPSDKAAIERALPKGYTMEWNQDFDQSVMLLSRGKLQVDDVLQKVFVTEDTQFSIALSMGRACLIKHVEEQALGEHIIPIVTYHCDLETMIGKRISVISSYWEIKGSTSYTTVFGDTRTAVEVVPVNLNINENQ